MKSKRTTTLKLRSTGQSSTQVVKETKKITHDWQDYYCERSFKMKPVNSASLAQFASDWIAAAEKDVEYIYIHRFPRSQGVSRPTIEGWKQRSPEMKGAYEHVKELCLMRQIEGSINRKMDGNFVKWFAPSFDEDLLKYEDKRAKMRDENANANGPQIVVIEKYPETNVPKAKK